MNSFNFITGILENILNIRGKDEITQEMIEKNLEAFHADENTMKLRCLWYMVLFYHRLVFCRQLAMSNRLNEDFERMMYHAMYASIKLIIMYRKNSFDDLCDAEHIEVSFLNKIE